MRAGGNRERQRESGRKGVEGREGREKKKKHPSTTAFKTLFIKLKAEKKSSAAH